MERARVAELILLANEADLDTLRMGTERALLALKVTGFNAALGPGFRSLVLLGLGLARLDRFK